MASMEIDSANSNASDPDNPRFSINGMPMSILKLFELFWVLKLRLVCSFCPFLSAVAKFVMLD